jgi:predicted ATP-binding protein involved in virulence
MKLKTVRLQNYRAHTHLMVNFDEHFNAVVGINGSGKTSLLSGVCEVFNGLFWRTTIKFPYHLFQEPGHAQLKMIEIDGRYRFEPQYPVVVQATGHAFDSDYDWSAIKNDVTHGKIHGKQPVSGLQSSEVKVTLPLLAFYRANRQWTPAKASELQAATEKHSRLDAYEQWWDASLSSSRLQSWVIAKCLERFQRSSETGILFNDIQDDELALVNGALASAVENVKGLRYDMQQKSLLLDSIASEDQPNDTIVFENLSDGQKVVIGLIADIARRMCLLNPHLKQEVTQQTPGVVLIDELDIHLHPKWQRIVTNGLKSAFPALQFIVASHAPQILGELKPEEIILLRPGGTTYSPQVSYGLDSSRVLEEIMGASSRDENVKKKLNALFAEIENNEFDSAKTSLKEITKIAPGIPELDAAEALIYRKEALGR